MTTLDLPYISIKKYAELMGETVTAVRQQVNAGYLPIKPRKGPHSRVYINMELLRKQAREAEY